MQVKSLHWKYLRKAGDLFVLSCPHTPPRPPNTEATQPGSQWSPPVPPSTRHLVVCPTVALCSVAVALGSTGGGGMLADGRGGHPRLAPCPSRASFPPAVPLRLLPAAAGQPLPPAAAAASITTVVVFGAAAPLPLRWGPLRPAGHPPQRSPLPELWVGGAGQRSPPSPSPSPPLPCLPPPPLARGTDHVGRGTPPPRRRARHDAGAQLPRRRPHRHLR